MTEFKTKCIESLDSLFQKYEKNDYMLQRIHSHILNYLPNTLENELKNFEKRKNRNTFLTNEQQIFVQVFLQKNLYYYLTNNNFFYEYNGKHYMIVKEDDIIHKLLSSISKDKVLLEWKYKTKTNIIKLIKERRSLFTNIPESDTIQNVLNILYPSIFTSKNHVKYFLTIIGDNIFKKNQHLIFLVSGQMKKILNDLDATSSLSIGINNITHNFVTKYHENHSYENCRLIKINETFSKELWIDILKKIGLDLLCVAAHYSKRYENSDNFIENKSDEELKNYTNYIKQNTQGEIIDVFCKKYINEIPTGKDSGKDSGKDIGKEIENIHIEWKNIHFVWKQFLSDNHYPNMLYSNTLKNLLKEKYKYNEESDLFLGITSKFVPIQRDFIQFWETNIQNTNTNVSINANAVGEYENVFDNELEIDEICSLFKLWAKQNNENSMTNGNISEETALKILKHFFSHIEIIEDKYILNSSCLLWDKIKDMNDSFKYIKEELKEKHTEDLISFDEAYNYYYKFCSLHSYKFVVSKRYFEKYMYFKFADYIVYEKFIETSTILHNII